MFDLYNQFIHIFFQKLNYAELCNSKFEQEVSNTTRMTLSHKRKFIQWFKDQVSFKDKFGPVSSVI